MATVVARVPLHSLSVGTGPYKISAVARRAVPYLSPDYFPLKTAGGVSS